MKAERLVAGSLRTRWRWIEGGHPIPTRSSLAAAEAALALLDRANQEGALMIFLISGGGSAMIEWPINEDITLPDLRSANKTLVNSGASISEINSVRRAFSAIKGGKLAARAPNCDQITLIVSDVPEGQEYNVASGPTMQPPADTADARDVIARYELGPRLPEPIVQAIDHPPEPAIESDLLRKHFVLISNNDAVGSAASAAERRGFVIEIATDISDQQIMDGCEQLLARLRALRAKTKSDAPVCLVSGGEFACSVLGDGIGGRNLETCLRLALLNLSKPIDFVALCAGTDGVDGNSAAAGATVDSTTIDRAKALGRIGEDFLRRSDAFPFFDALGDALITGPTGTNVRDLRVLLVA